MENASKALIIAGAILLAILLISLGILIFNQAQDTVNNSGMSQAEITSFNNKFLKYEGNLREGSVAKSLVSEVLTSNSDSNNSNRKITIKLGNTPITSTSSIKVNKKYDIELTYATGETGETNTTKGCIKEVKLIEK